MTVAASHQGALSGRTVAILGGTSGIGLATAVAALASGANLVVTGRDEARLEAAAHALGPGARTARVDAADPDQSAAFFSTLGTVDHLFTTVGTHLDDNLLSCGLDDIEDTMSQRYRAAVLVARHCPAVLNRAGSITFTSGIAAWRPMGSVASAAACAAIESMTHTLAVALAPIRVNAVSPGYVRTPLLDRVLGDHAPQQLSAAAAQTPARRIGDPEDVAAAVLFLMSASFVTGVVLPVDGGRRLV